MLIEVKIEESNAVRIRKERYSYVEFEQLSEELRPENSVTYLLVQDKKVLYQGKYQLQVKDEQLKQMQKLLDQQQQLTLQANQQIEKLQEQLQLTYTEESPENESTVFSEDKEPLNDTPPTSKRKWWQIWKA
ncbi:hypothetical protein IGJ18_002928 [Enterococcus sp. AZ078]